MQLVAHRGFAAEHPKNTLAALRWTGVDGVIADRTDLLYPSDATSRAR